MAKAQSLSGPHPQDLGKFIFFSADPAEGACFTQKKKKKWSIEIACSLNFGE